MFGVVVLAAAAVRSRSPAPRRRARWSSGRSSAAWPSSRSRPRRSAARTRRPLSARASFVRMLGEVGPDGRPRAGRPRRRAAARPPRRARGARRRLGAGRRAGLRARRARPHQRGHRVGTDPVADALRRAGAGARRAARRPALGEGGPAAAGHGRGRAPSATSSGPARWPGSPRSSSGSRSVAGRCGPTRATAGPSPSPRVPSGSSTSRPSTTWRSSPRATWSGTVLLPPRRMKVLTMYTTEAFPVVPARVVHREHGRAEGEHPGPPDALRRRRAASGPFPSEGNVREALEQLDVDARLRRRRARTPTASWRSTGRRVSATSRRLGSLTCLSLDRP